MKEAIIYAVTAILFVLYVGFAGHAFGAEIFQPVIIHTTTGPITGCLHDSQVFGGDCWDIIRQLITQAEATRA